MNLPLMNLAVLISTATSICVAMTLCWVYFGRFRYAQLWAISAAGSAVQWMFTVLTRVTVPDALWPLAVTGILVVIDSALLAIGALDRSKRDLRLGWFATAGTIAVAAMSYGLLVEGSFAIRGFIANAFATVMALIAAYAIIPLDRRLAVPEVAVMIAFIAFGLLELALTTISLGIGPDSEGTFATYRDLLTIGLPAAYSALGISAVFVLANDLHRQLRSLVMRDAATGSLNRRGIEQAAGAAIANARRNGRALSVIVGDIDGFKRINDRFGHAAGDVALAHFADTIQASVREDDVLGRLGGDEFCLLLIETDPADALATVERIRQEVAASHVPGMPELTLTASFGIAGLAAGDTFFSEILNRADRGLHDAKNAGRNRAVLVSKA